MVWYLLKIAYLLIFWLITITTYYSYSFHVESFNQYSGYFISVFIIYFIYKAVNYVYHSEKIKFSPLKIFGLFLLNLLVLCVLFFTLNDSSGAFGATLFFKIIWYLFLPTLIIFSNISFWKFVLSKINDFDKETSIFQFLTSLGVWFFSFVTLITIIWFFGFYNYISLFVILLTIIWVSYKEFLSLLKSIYSYEFEIEDHKLEWNFFEILNLKLLTTEFLFIIITFLISINLINIVRPMPIWWDDLGVYMNFPQLLANSWTILPLWWMLSWQIFTWIWYMFKSSTQAFFLNNVWWILSVIVIILSLTDLLKSSKKTFINIPFLAAATFISMPMVIFQQAKDMKLDSWLFFVSVICVYMMLYIFIKYIWYTREFKSDNFELKENIQSNNKTLEVKIKSWFNNLLDYVSKYTHIWARDIFSNKSYLIYIFIIWILAWFAFSIKVTSLILISAIIWVIFYSKLWVSGLLWYFSIYVWIFTKAWLWSMMNVVYPKDDLNFINTFFVSSMFVWLIFLAYSINKYSLKVVKKLFLILSLFIAWVVVSLIPYITFNISTLDNISITWIITWQWLSYSTDYSKIYTKDELKKIENNNKSSAVSSSWTTSNEDWWRYFWYESWINNYLKLPYNLSMQTNQKWEFTDITYIFLALLPALLLFFAYKNNYFLWTSFVISLSPLLYFLPTSSSSNYISNKLYLLNNYLTTIFWGINIPFWYIFIALFFLVPMIFLLYSLNKEKFSNLLRLNVVFVAFYVFLWSISAFWVVWYWITMYYAFLLTISIWYFYISSYEDNDLEKVKILKFWGSLVAFFIICTYFFASSIPHWMSNLKDASYISFKAGQTPPYTTIFMSQSSYFDVLVDLNIKKEKQTDLFKNIVSNIKNENILTAIQKSSIDSLSKLNWLLMEVYNLDQNSTWNNIQIAQMKSEWIDIQENMYKNILYPTDEFKNDVWIYRIWTFLKYFIADNYKRIYEDGLVTQFNDYFYDEKDINLWIERMKKLWLSYFLVDLNAATIDKDPRHDLTKRFENLLKTFSSDKLELVSTDSICLKVALEEYNKSQKTQNDLEKYIRLAWVNYESYTSSWETVLRWLKQYECYNEILSLINNKKVDSNNYTYLAGLSDYISKNTFKSEEELLKLMNQYIGHGWLVLFRIK